jgi:hypothetical protein
VDVRVVDVGVLGKLLAELEGWVELTEELSVDDVLAYLRFVESLAGMTGRGGQRDGIQD